MKCANLGVVILLFATASVALARQPGQQEDTVAAASRRAREQKQQQAKAPKVWDNDNIPKNPGALSVIGQSAPENPSPSDSSGKEDSKTAASADAKKAPATAAEQKATIETELAAAKDQLQTLQNDLDILQRKYTLDEQTYYGKTNYAADKAGAASLQDEHDQIDSKQQEIIAVQQKIADLQTQLSAADSLEGSETKSSAP